jgi:hypothetical protein
MSTAPGFKSPDSLPFTSSERQETIRRLWTFAAGLRLENEGAATGAVLVARASDGRLQFVTVLSLSELTVLTETTIGGNFTANGAAISIGSATSNVTITDINDIILSQGGLSGVPVFRGHGNTPPGSGQLSMVGLTGRVANIASTALSSTPPAGLYAVEAYLVTTTNDVTAGTLALTVGYTDVGGARTATVIAAHPLTALSPSTGRQFLQLASGNISYATTVTGIFGSSAYAVYLRVIALG